MRFHPLALALISGGVLQAGIVGYNFSGTVIGVQGPPEPGFAGLGIGSHVSGSFTYDTNAPGTVSYAVQTMFLQVGPLVYSPAAPVIQIDLAGEYNWEAGGQGGNPTFSVDLILRDSFPPFLHADTLLRPPPDPATVDVHHGLLSFIRSPESNSTILDFNIDTITACSVSPGGVRAAPACDQPSNSPEPSMFGLLAAALGLIPLLKARSRHIEKSAKSRSNN